MKGNEATLSINDCNVFLSVVKNEVLERSRKYLLIGENACVTRTNSIPISIPAKAGIQIKLLGSANEG